ncbi:MAG TPA: M14 family metallopeptidase [Egibacteraceae bacterium]|nr:M14 family metallopeptidase [Egibacteraceae bacterium]
MTHPRLDTVSLSRRDLLRSMGAGAALTAVATAVPAALAAPASAATTTVAGAKGAAAPLQLARVWAFSRAHRALLAELDDTHRVFADGSAEYLLWPGDELKLQTAGMSYEITVADVAARDAAIAAAAPARPVDLPLQPGETNGEYRRLPDFEADMRSLAERFPDKARLIELPEKTLEGRTVYGLEIATDVERNDGRPVFYNDGIHHAREWPAAEVPIMWAFDLLENYGVDPRITNIVDHVRNIVVPVVNPDGFNLSREFPVNQSVMGSAPYQIGQGQYVRKNRRSELGDAVGQHGPGNLTSYGVDPNRNYAYAWGDNIGGSSSSKTSQTYRGTEPFSEAESRNVSHLLRTHHATAMITHHTSGDLVLWAWGDTTDDAPDDGLLQGLGRACAAFNRYRPQKSIQLYATTGTTSDYAYGVFGSIGYTFEHAGSSFHPPYPSTVPAMYAKNREALILLCEEGCLPPEKRPADRTIPPVLTQHTSLGVLNHCIILGRLVDADGNGVAGTVRLHKEFETLLWKDGNGGNPTGKASVTEVVDTVMETNADGTFEYHVNPSTRPYLTFKGERETYELTATAAGGGASATRDVFVARGQWLNLGDVQLG